MTEEKLSGIVDNLIEENEDIEYVIVVAKTAPEILDEKITISGITERTPLASIKIAKLATKELYKLIKKKRKRK